MNMQLMVVGGKRLMMPSGHARGQQTLTPKGIMHTPGSGIWQTVWLEPVAEAHIMSYLVYNAKHHDGFAMFHTMFRPEYSIAAAPFKRDVVKEISEACHNAGLRFGIYYSQRDRTHPDYGMGDNRK